MSGYRELGEFLRSRRARLRPDDVGIVAQRRRREPGLRAEWYIRLEQGRAVSPSEETVEALGRFSNPRASSKPNRMSYPFATDVNGVDVRCIHAGLSPSGTKRPEGEVPLWVQAV
jgi:hypothetical protein